LGKPMSLGHRAEGEKNRKQLMLTRTRRKNVTFKNPFWIGQFDELQAAGDYLVETDEELILGLSFPAYRRVSERIHLHENKKRPGTKSTLTISPEDLEAALLRDQPEDIDLSGHASVQQRPEGTPATRETNADWRDVDRAEDEGMITHHHERCQVH
jgi:hypothetical protein